jgi:hypothetical protein
MTCSRGKRSALQRILDIDAFDRQRLRINAKGGEFAALVLPDMPMHLRSTLMSTLKLTFPTYIKPTDSKSKGEDFEYPSLRFCWYNKYTLQVNGSLEYFLFF